MKRLLLLAILGLMTVGASAQRITDKLDRGIVAVPIAKGNLVSWRKFGSEYYDTKYNLYRNGTKIATEITVSNYQDASGDANSKYAVEAVVKGVAQTRSAEVKAWANNYYDVKVQPVVNRAGKTIPNSVSANSKDASGSNYESQTPPGYVLNDVSLADVTGDGISEFIVKRNNAQGNLSNPSNTTDFNHYECYKLDGTRLWWIDLGPNLMSNPDEQYDLIGYDWDCDGKAECVMRGADNMIIHTATGHTINIGDMTFDCGKGLSSRPEYVGVGAEYLLYLNGETGEPYGWDGSDNWTPEPFPLPRFEANEKVGDANVWGDVGHRATKIYMGAPYLDGRRPSIFFGRGAYTRHKFCALDVDPVTHQLTQRWRWNCYDASSAWYGNGFHNYQIADVDLDGRDEIMFGSMCIDDTGYGLSTTGLGHGDAQHCGDLDPYRWGLEQFTCQEGAQGNSFWNPTTGQIYYRKSDGGDDGRAMAGNFTNAYPGGQARSASSSTIGLSSCKILPVNGISNLNMRIYWDGDLLDEMFDPKNGAVRPGTIYKWNGNIITNFEAISNNWTKCNPSAQGDILGDWREELVLRTADNSSLRIHCTTYPTEYDIYTLWNDHQYRNAMAWQCVGYNQPPHVSYFIGELEGITIAPPPLILEGRTEVSGSIATTTDHLLVSGYEDKTISVAEGASPWVLTVNTPAWVKGTGSQQATASTPKTPARDVITYTTTLTGGAFGGATRLVKQGEGVLVLPNVTEKHTGATDVWNGTLQFDGTMESSPVWLNRHTTLISNGGNFKGGLKADYNATIYPGGQRKVGSITASTLSLGFGSRVVFDVKSDGIDQLNATKITIETKNWEYGPKYSTPVFEFVGASQLAAGTYLLGQVGSIEGNINDILIEGLADKHYYLSLVNGQLSLVLEDMRAPASVVWNGDNSSIYDLASTKNFLNNGVADISVDGDDLIFDDNAVSTTVEVKGAVRPNSITFNNETKNYTLKGDSILGGVLITKNGKGTVTISNENRTGTTTINNGKLIVNALANRTGVDYGALGNYRQNININDGGALGFSESVITDQPVNVRGEVTIDVPTNLGVTFNQGFKGEGATVSKTGVGRLTTGPSGTYSKLIIKQGRVNSVAYGNVDQLPETVEFWDGVLWGENMEDTPGITNRTNFVVPEGKKGEFRGSFRGTYNGTLTGAGTFVPVSGGVRCYWNGDWSEFEGTIAPLANDGTNRQNKKSYTPSFNITNTKGFPKATLDLGTDQIVSNQDPNSGKAYNVSVGHITGTGTLSGSGTYTIGLLGKNITSKFKSTSPLVKRGAGALRPGAGCITGMLTVEEGVLQFNSTDMTTSYIASVTLKEKGELEAAGLMGGLTMESGTMATPKKGQLSSPATLKSSASVNVKQGATLRMVINSKTVFSKLEANFLTMNGTLKVELGSSYTPAVGDEFTLWTITRTFSGTPTFDLPELPNGLYWDVTALKAKTGVLRITDDATVGIGRIGGDELVSCNVYTVGGVFVGSFEAQRSSVRSEVQKLGVKSGLYIVRMAAGRNYETETVTVR